MKNKLKEYRNFEIVEPCTLFCPYIKGTFEARIITSLFQGDLIVENLIIYYN